MEPSLDDFKQNPHPVGLKPGVQHYAWGDPQFIPDLFGLPNPENLPHAELWMGAHPNLPSMAIAGGRTRDLNGLIQEAGVEILGADVAGRFQRLPYLLKVLAVARPLSIQVHPSKRRAEEGFARENAAGIPRTAPHRNYRDDNHKPELLVALKDFYALRGFRPEEEIAEVLRNTPELGGLLPEFQPTPQGLRALYETFMKLRQGQVDAILGPLLERLRREHQQEPIPKDHPKYWILRGDEEFTLAGRRDRGLLAIPLLNLVHLKPGQALYLPPGTLHAYLEGAGLELLGNSDNVIRCGLTPKHVDVPEVLKTSRFEGERPRILEASRISGSNEWRYETPAEEFELRRIELTPPESHKNNADHSAEILAVLDLKEGARLTVSSCGLTFPLSRGGILLIPYGKEYTIGSSGPATIYKATVPLSHMKTGGIQRAP